MNKQTVELTIPEGYEVAEGEQPRLPKAGDYYLTDELRARESDKNFVICHCVILKKKAPEYVVIDHSYSIPAASAGRFVEIKALEDALTLVPVTMTHDEKDIYKTLKALVEGGL